MQINPETITDVQDGSLLHEAFLTVEGQSRYGCLGAFTVFCMSNGASQNPVDLWPEGTTFCGPTLVDLCKVRRTVGVGPMSEISEEPNEFYSNVDCIEQNILEGFQPPPLVTERRKDGCLYLLDGNHTKFTLQRRLRVPKYWTIEARPSTP